MSEHNSGLLKGQLDVLSKCEKLERDREQEILRATDANRRFVELEEEYSMEKSAM